MAVLEIVIPTFKKDLSLLKDFAETLGPELFTKAQGSGARNGLHGSIVTQDGKDVRDEIIQVLLIEWPEEKNFKDFVTSPYFPEFASKATKYVDAPSRPKIFEVPEGVDPVFASPEAVIEHVAVRPRDASEAGIKAALQTLRAALSQFAGPGARGAVVGESLNTETKEIALVGVYNSDAELETAKASTGRQQFLADLAKIADVTDVVITAKKVF